MRVLRLLTTSFVILSIFILLSYPWTVGLPAEEGAPREVQVAYARRMFIYFTASALALLAALTCALLLVRRIRQQFVETSVGNLADLLTSQQALMENSKKDEQ